MILTASVLGIVILQPVMCLRTYFNHWPVREVPVAGTRLTRYVFKNYNHSQQLCIEAYAPWWNVYLPRRRSFNIRGFLGPLTSEIPPLRTYVAPVQSMGSRLGGNRAGENMNPGSTPYCTTVCEELRSDLEIWLTSKIEGKQQARYKMPFQMMCPEGYYADIVEAVDLREPVTEELWRLSVLISLQESSFRISQDYPSYEVFKPRVIGQPVDHCRCKRFLARLPQEIAQERIAAEQRYAAEYEAQRARSSNSGSASWAGSSENIAGMRFAQQENMPHPYADGSSELENAVNMWAQTHPDEP